MHHDSGAALTVAIALAFGMASQTVARHLRVPGIVALLLAGVLLGPDVLHWVDPDSLGSALQVLVGFAVAIILFEGGLNLSFRQLRSEARSIRQLVTLGAVVTAVGGALAARFFLQWSWTVSILFGTLVIVTGPTVISPLLRRIRVAHRIETVLEAEGVFGDAIGALIAVVSLGVALQFAQTAEAGAVVTRGVWDLFSRFGVGGGIGVVAGLLLALLLRSKKLIPEGLTNVFALSIALVVFQLSDAVRPESGIVAVIVAGLAVANSGSHALDGLRDFKEQLTVMLIGMLFVLLAADVRLEDVQSLGWPGALTVAALMFVVRPLNIVVGTWGSGFGWREKAFLSWMAPRGIVAAAVASLFAIALDDAGIEGGKELRALVFLVIAVTVTVNGLTAGLAARLLGLRPPPPSALLILGANSLGRALAGAGRDAGRNVFLIDSNPENCKAAEEQGFKVRYGSGLDENLLRRARIDDCQIAVAVLANEGVNLAFAKLVRELSDDAEVRVGLRLGLRTVTPDLIARSGAKILFAEARNLEFWKMKLDRNEAKLETWSYQGDDKAEASSLMSPEEESSESKRILLPVAILRGEDRMILLDADTRLRTDDRLRVAILDEAKSVARERLRAAGFVAPGSPDLESPTGASGSA